MSAGKVSHDTHLDTCGCCETDVVAPRITNPPGQPALAYRVGTHAAILRRLIAELPSHRLPDGDHEGDRPLGRLTTRSPDDPAMALLDGWASLEHVLAFYQERIANEGFIRTAVERRSVLELARAIGYELNPGVAASAYLAFQVDESEGSPRTVAMSAGVQVQSIPAAKDELPQTFETIDDFEARKEWNELKPSSTETQAIKKGVRELYLAGVDTRLKPGDGILLVGDERVKVSGSERWDFRILQTVETFPAEQYTRVTWETGLGHDKPTVHPADNPKVYAFRTKAKLFGHNAPDWRAMSEEIRAAYDPEDPNDPNDIAGSASNWPGFSNQTATERLVDLDNTYDGITVDSWVVLTRPGYLEVYRVTRAETDSRTDFTLTGQVTRLEVDTNEHLSWFGLRDTAVYAESVELTQTGKPVTAPVSGNTIELDRVVDGLVPGQPLVVTGKADPEDEETLGETVVLSTTVSAAGRTKLVLAQVLSHTYVRDTVTIFANVVRATHGETVSAEVLGSGDGTQRNQRFTLKKSPLTHTSAATASGGESTLELRVNGVRWQQASSLYRQGPTRAVYVVRIDDDAKASVLFGDGVNGARLPTGQENIDATYRTGVGADGEVGADSLRLLKTRPFGIRSVTNPQPASGAEDPESLADARENAPLTVLTLDRVVSLQDYEDFARAFAGIGKARAVALWNGELQVVHVTVADASGDELATDSETFANLSEAIDQASDPLRAVELGTYERWAFRLEAGVLIDGAYAWDAVSSAIESALIETFSFKTRSFGQPVTAAELVETMHSIEGVIAADIDTLHRITKNGARVGPKFSSVLAAENARFNPAPTASPRYLPAELLLIDESGITLTRLTS